MSLQHRAEGSKLSTSFPLLIFPPKHEVSKKGPGITGAACVSISVSNDILDLLENPTCGRGVSCAKPTVVQKSQRAEFGTAKVSLLICKDNHIPAHSPSPEDTEIPNSEQELILCSFFGFFGYTNRKVAELSPPDFLQGGAHPSVPRDKFAVGLARVKDTQRCLK